MNHLEAKQGAEAVFQRLCYWKKLNIYGQLF